MMNGYANTYAKQAKQYKQQDIETASKEELLIMLYEGAIKFLIVAKKALDEQNAEKFHNNIVRAERIVVEFMTSLDFEVGGETAKNLYALYEYYYFRLVQANLKKDVTMIDEVLGHLRQLKATWEEAIRLSVKELKELEEFDDAPKQSLSA